MADDRWLMADLKPDAAVNLLKEAYKAVNKTHEFPIDKQGLAIEPLSDYS